MTVLASLLVLIGLLALVLASRMRSQRRLGDLRSVLESAYLEDRPMEGDNAADLRTVLARGGAAAEKALGGTSVFARIRTTLERSDWTLTAGEFAAVSVAVAGLGLLLGLTAASPALAFLLTVGGVALPYVLVTRSVSKRRTRFDDQFPDVLDLIAASLESGGGVSQALELVVSEADEPSASEFARVLAATRLGGTLVGALREMADRLDSRDLRYTVQAISVQQTTGGKLADVLRVVADFMRGRAEIRREIQALTAEGRLSAYILGGLPFALAGFISLSNPGYLTPLFTTFPGLVMLVGASVFMLIAFFLMARIIKIEV